MPYESLGEFVAKLEGEGCLLRIGKDLDIDQEISAVFIKAGDKAVLCEKIKGYDIPVVGNLFAHPSFLRLALELKSQNILGEYLSRLTNPIPPRQVADGPVKEKVYLADKLDLLEQLPIPKINAKDGGRYISAGIIVARDPEFGTNLALHRLHIKGKRRAGIYMSQLQHLYLYYKRAEEKGKPLDIAVIIGADPSLYLASVVQGPPDMDEYAVAGAVRAKPVETVRCQTVDLEVPAQAEIVLEGKMLPHLREPEGPFGEFSRYYGPDGDRPVVEFTALTCRSRPFFQNIYLGRRQRDNIILTGLPKAADLFRCIREVASEVRDVHLTPGGCGRYHAVISLRKRFEGEPKAALAVVLASRIGVKHAVVVDEDIDIHDPSEVEWAVATRSQFDMDAVMVNDIPVQLDPSTHFKRKTGYRSAKVGIDATRPLGVAYPEVCDVAPEVMEKVEKDWPNYLKG